MATCGFQSKKEQVIVNKQTEKGKHNCSKKRLLTIRMKCMRILRRRIAES